MSAQALNLSPVERRDLFRQVLDQLIGYIEANNLQPGDRLPGDRELAASLRVSRPLVRQALKVLEGLGRVTAQQGLGTFVADGGMRVAVSELLRGMEPGFTLRSQLLAVRTLLDKEALIAAVRADPDHLMEDLDRVLQERQDELREGPEEASLDLAFEATFGRHAGNAILARLQALCHDAWLELQIDEDVPLADRFALHRDHVAIASHIREGDIPKAIALFDTHAARIKL